MMSFIITGSESSGKDFEKLPLGPQQGVCSFVEDLGTHNETYEGKTSPKRKLVIVWELAENLTAGQFAGEPFVCSRRFTVSLNERASLRKFLEAWRGRPFTAEELKGFDLHQLIGANCMLNIIAYTKQDGNEGRKVDSIMPLFKGLPKIEKRVAECPEWIAAERAKAIGAAPVPVTIENNDLPF
jgi:hypothetical protein